MEGLVEKHKDVNFIFVYFSDFIDDCGLAIEAASFQDRFMDYHRWLMIDNNAYEEKPYLINHALEIGLDGEIFQATMNDHNTIKKLIENRDYLITNGIYSTPCFIVNGKIMNQGNTIEYLSLVIEDELNKVKSLKK